MRPEEEILALVMLCDDARAEGDLGAVAHAEARIAELKKVVGNRTITGEATFEAPLPEAEN